MGSPYFQRLGAAKKCLAFYSVGSTSSSLWVSLYRETMGVRQRGKGTMTLGGAPMAW
jgi:hypothetical protein